MTVFEYLSTPFILSSVFIFGLIVGSFLNVCISRWPAEQSVVFPRSRCPKCKKLIAWFDNVPVLSWLLLRAKCRHCDQKISWIYPGVEVLTACLFVGIWKALLFTLPKAETVFTTGDVILFLVTGLFLMGISIVVFFVDVKHYEIPDEISLNMMPLGPLLCLFFPVLMSQTLYLKLHEYPIMLQGNLYCEHWLHSLMMSVGGVVVGGGLLWLLAIVGEKLLKKEAMGFGDVKLLAMLGGFLGIEGVVMTLVIASCLGAVYGVVSYILTRDNKLPFGPWLVIGGLLVFVAKYEMLRAMTSFLRTIDLGTL